MKTPKTIVEALIWRSVRGVLKTRRRLAEWVRVTNPFTCSHPSGRHFLWRYYDKNCYGVKDWPLLPTGKWVIIAKPFDVISLCINGDKNLLSAEEWNDVISYSGAAKIGYELDPPSLEIVDGELKIVSALHSAMIADILRIPLIPFLIDTKSLTHLHRNDVSYLKLD